MSLRGSTAIVGMADTAIGKLPESSPTTLCVEAFLAALADAGIDKSQVDGLITCNSMAEPYMYHAEMIAEYLQIFPGYCMAVGSGGGTTFTAVHHAAAAIFAGQCETVVIAMADCMLTGLSREQSMAVMASTGHGQFERPYGPIVPAYYALIARAHMSQYGTTAEQMAAVMVNARANAALHPGAQIRETVTIEDVLNSRYIADPLHLLDCSLISDGGSAIVMTSAERAKDFPHKPVYLLGAGEGHGHEHISEAQSLTTSAAKQAGDLAYSMAGLGPKDIDLAGLYDCFTPVVIVELEDLGFCEKGEGGAYAASGAINRDGELPVNTHGGLLAHGHPGNPGSMFHLTEAITQLRGDGGDRQIADAQVALVHGQGGIMSSHTTLILGTER